MERHAIPSINTHPFTPEKWIQLQQTLKSSEWQQTVPEGLNPFQLADKRLDKQASFLIYDENNQHLIGWYIGHQLSEVAWQVTSIFIRKAYRKKNIGLAAIREMAIRHQNRGRVHFMVQPENTKMLAYINRYLTRWGCELFQQVVASKKL
jgi:predicted acetyltransferase